MTKKLNTRRVFIHIVHSYKVQDESVVFQVWTTVTPGDGDCEGH